MTRDERQDLAIEKWRKAKGNATIVAATGFGKTRIAFKTIRKVLDKRPHLKILVIVPTENLQIQWQMQIIELGLVNNCDVMVINTAVKHQRDYDFLICDETHLYVSDTFVKIFENVTYKYLMCLTGTIERLDGKEVLLKKFAPVCDEVTMNDALENGWVAEYKQYKVLIDVDLTEYKKHNAKFMAHFAYFNYNFDLAMKCATDNNFRFAYAARANLQVRDVMIHAMGFMREMKARKEFIYSHPKKIELADKILKARTNKKVLTFSKTVVAAKELCCGDIYHGGLNKKKRAELLSTFNESATGVLHSARALNTGSDIKGLEVAIILSGDSSSITKTQTVGRAVRKEGEKIAEIFHFVIRGTVDESWFVKGNKNLNHTDIDEAQLLELLEGKPLEKKIHKETKFLFRF